MSLSRLFPLATAMILATSGPSFADMYEPLQTRLSDSLVTSFFPNADGFDVSNELTPFASVTADGSIAGYLFSTHEMAKPRGFKGDSFDIVIGLDAGGRLLGHQVLEQHEPLVSPDKVSEAELSQYLSRLNGYDVRTGKGAMPGGLDAVSGATISAKAMHDAMLRAIDRVGLLVGLSENRDVLRLDMHTFAPADWTQLLKTGSVVELRLNNQDVRRAIYEQFGADAQPVQPLGDDGALFTAMYTALLTPPAIGQNLMPIRHYNLLFNSGTHSIMLAAEGKGTWWNGQGGGLFDRVMLVQDGLQIQLTRENFKRSRLENPSAPSFDAVGRINLSMRNTFDPLQPWSIEIRVPVIVPDQKPGILVLPLVYRLPAQHVIGDDAALEEAGLKAPNYILFGLVRASSLSDWQRIWVDRSQAITGLAVLLLILTGILFFHETLTTHRRLYAVVRTGFLLTVLVWLGWIAGAQLTILHLLTYLNAARGIVDWRAQLVDPLIVILSGYVLISLVLWGRGVFCGWLCPFGALQELTNKFARLVRIPQVTVPHTLQARFWSLKYVVVLVILGLAVSSSHLVASAVEIEPFKTAISTRFDRAWPYVLYAALLLGAGLVVERFYCRYLCPLGAAVAFLGRIHVLSWLRRRPECGNPCHICEASCPVGAIERSGKINMAECFQCLDCQVDYFDDHKCPPLVQRRKRVESIQLGSLSGATTV